MIRQGNTCEKVYVYSYVTKGTFDAYLYQTLENKQKFIGQIMTSKSPARTCEDVDEQALDYVEIKAQCAGDPRIKEKLELDIEVSKLQQFQNAYLGMRAELEDKINLHYPKQIERLEHVIKGCISDIELVNNNPLPEGMIKLADGSERKEFVGIEIKDRVYGDPKSAGEALLDALRLSKSGNSKAVLGHYRGFEMTATYNFITSSYILTLKAGSEHNVELGTSATGNFTRIDNCLDNIEKSLNDYKERLDRTKKALSDAKEEIKKPFEYEKELEEKTERLNYLNAELKQGGDSSEDVRNVAEDVVEYQVEQQKIM